jgi:flagellar motor switch protein FliN
MSPAEAQRNPEPSPQDSIVAGRIESAATLDALLDVSMPIVIEIGRAQMTVQEVLQLGAGSVIQLDRIVGEPVDIYVSDRRLAQGEVVVVGEYFGVRITRVLANQGVESAA